MSFRFCPRSPSRLCETAVAIEEKALAEPDRFCFYRCLTHSDKRLFVSTFFSLDPSMLDIANFYNGGINVSLWVKVMRACSSELSNTYFLFVERGVLEYVADFGVRGRTVSVVYSNNHMFVASAIDAFEPLSSPLPPVLMAYGNSIPSREDHEALVREFRNSEIVNRFKNTPGQNPILTKDVLEDVFTTLRSKLTSRFSYINCLHVDDERIFMDTLLDDLVRKANAGEILIEDVLARTASGGIEFGAWREIMGRARLTRNYVLWRRAYWGENSHEFSDSTVYSFYHCVVEEFTGNSDTTVNLLFDGYGWMSQLSDWFLNPSKSTDPDRSIPSDVLVY
jgi:hypothetical protein